MTTQKINWPAVVKVIQLATGNRTHALCCCAKCMSTTPPPPPLCGVKVTAGRLRDVVNCPSCIAILDDPERRAEHE